MRRLLIVLSLGCALLALATAVPAQAEFHWNVKCQTIHVKGIKVGRNSCARRVTHGHRWMFQYHIVKVRFYTPTGKQISKQYIGHGVLGPATSDYKLYRPGAGRYGTYHEVAHGVPQYVSVAKTMIVVATAAAGGSSTPPIKKPPKPPAHCSVATSAMTHPGDPPRYGIPASPNYVDATAQVVCDSYPRGEYSLGWTVPGGMSRSSDLGGGDILHFNRTGAGYVSGDYLYPIHCAQPGPGSVTGTIGATFYLDGGPSEEDQYIFVAKGSSAAFSLSCALPTAPPPPPPPPPPAPPTVCHPAITPPHNVAPSLIDFSVEITCSDAIRVRTQFLLAGVTNTATIETDVAANTRTVIETQQSCLLAFGTIQAFPHTTMSCVPSYCAHLRNPIIIDDVVPQPPVQITC